MLCCGNVHSRCLIPLCAADAIPTADKTAQEQAKKGAKEAKIKSLVGKVTEGQLRYAIGILLGTNHGIEMSLYTFLKTMHKDAEEVQKTCGARLNCVWPQRALPLRG